jgi:hypothetical protein
MENPLSYTSIDIPAFKGTGNFGAPPKAAADSGTNFLDAEKEGESQIRNQSSFQFRPE